MEGEIRRIESGSERRYVRLVFVVEEGEKEVRGRVSPAGPTRRT